MSWCASMLTIIHVRVVIVGVLISANPTYLSFDAPHQSWSFLSLTCITDFLATVFEDRSTDGCKRS